MINFDVVNDIPTTNKTVFLLADLDVPLDEYGKIANDEKIQNAMKTINYLVKTGARVVIATHLGHPASEVDTRFSTKVIAKYLDKRMNCEVNFTPDCIGEQAKGDIFRTEYGDIIVLENLLFHKEEKECDMNFARQLADGMNVYVNDNFANSEYSYASVLAVPIFIRSTGGLLFTETIKNLDLFLSPNNKFTTAIIGGNKIGTKIDLLKNLAEHTKCIVLGGVIANTFLFTIGKNIENSIYEPDHQHQIEEIISIANKNDCLIYLPQDVKVAGGGNYDGVVNKKIDELSKDDVIVDLGDESVKFIMSMIDISRCIFWHGNTGIDGYNIDNSSTILLGEKISKLTRKKRLFSIVNGSDNTLSLQKAGYLKDFSFVSKTYQSTLKYMSGKVLPGLEVLKRLSKQMI